MIHKLHINQAVKYFVKSFMVWMFSLFRFFLDGKESACNVGDLGLIPGSGRSSVKGKMP